MKHYKKSLSFILTLLILTSAQAQQRIISLNGAISEMLCALGLESQIVGVDISSSYPASLQQKAKVGYNRTLSAEGVLALRPTLVLGAANELKPQVVEQLKAANVNTQIFTQEYTVEGTRKLLQSLAAITGTVEKGKQVLADFDKQMAGLQLKPLNKKVLFIYARGVGAMTICGSGTSPDQIIRLAGASNAVPEIKDFKPLSSEALVAANPDVLLLFDTGLESVGGEAGMLKVPGVSATNAGRNKKIVTMDGQFMAGFGLRLPQAIAELNKKLSL
ncbi:MAG: ABC transporter substrate-binding protein [Candidatus Pseudobacter hemicellulosilyticus]|uniref:ABC transporter substrate-binding protein n=1 Tax=Candidatus Pseudobacter hemicellulosilyticus TaxID=3121375 RepID=A0AAJ5WZK4_9BACT|nr:MAG: ABC transporter substrate-binding protein [Pseudobacter sp.]